MVNRGVVVVFSLLVVAAAGAGALVGLQLEGALSTTDGPTDTATPDGSTPARDTPTATATPRPTVAPSSFDAATVEAEILAMVNEERRARGLETLETLAPLREMARSHSGAMAVQGYPSHGAAGNTTADRYAAYDLDDRCRVVDDSGTSIREDKELEVVAKTVAGRPFGPDGGVARDETAVARNVVDSWFADDTASRRLTMRNAKRVGVGVVVASDGGVYATADLC